MYQGSELGQCHQQENLLFLKDNDCIHSLRESRHVIEFEYQRYISSPAQLISPFLPPENAPSIFTLKGFSSRWRSAKSIRFFNRDQ